MSSKSESQFGKIRLAGGRYERGGLPVFAMAELERYSKLVGTVAHYLYLETHPQRKRVPKGFDEVLDLRLIAIEDGSVIPVLERTEPESTLFGLPDVYERSRTLINDALREIGNSSRLPSYFPVKALSELAQFGRSLRDDEHIELSTPGEEPAVLNKAIRQRIQKLADLDTLEVEIVLLGQVTGLRSTPQQFDVTLTGPEKRKLQGSYSDPAMFELLHEFTGYAEQAPLTSISVVAKQDRDGALIAISDVLNVEAALPPHWASRVAELARVEDGWLNPTTAAPSKHVLELLDELLLGCVDKSIPRPLMFPSGEGGVQLEWRGINKNVEIEILNSGNIEAAWFELEGDADEEAVFRLPEVQAVVDFIGENVDG